MNSTTTLDFKLLDADLLGLTDEQLEQRYELEEELGLSSFDTFMMLSALPVKYLVEWQSKWLEFEDNSGVYAYGCYAYSLKTALALYSEKKQQKDMLVKLTKIDNYYENSGNYTTDDF